MTDAEIAERIAQALAANDGIQFARLRHEILVCSCESGGFPPQTFELLCGLLESAEPPTEVWTLLIALPINFDRLSVTQRSALLDKIVRAVRSGRAPLAPLLIAELIGANYPTHETLRYLREWIGSQDPDIRLTALQACYRMCSWPRDETVRAAAKELMRSTEQPWARGDRDRKPRRRPGRRD